MRAHGLGGALHAEGKHRPGAAGPVLTLRGVFIPPAEMPMLDDATVLIPEVFEVHARSQPDKEAVVCGPVRRSWGDFNANINRIARALHARGIGPGQQVAVMMGNAVEMLEAVFGTVKSGACVVPLSGLLTGEQLAGLLNDSGAVVAFAGADFRARLAPHLAECNALRPDGLVAMDALTAAEAAGATGSPLAPERATAPGLAPTWQPLADWLAASPGGVGEPGRTGGPPVALHAGMDFNIIYSSGTTGLPKGIVQTHRARTHWAFSNAIELGMGEGSRALTTTALYSNGTWLMMLPVLFSGGTCVAMPAFSPAGFLATVAAERITHSFMVPAQYIALLADPALASADTSSLQSLLCAGSPLRRDTKRAVLERFGPILTELYGFSEGFGAMLKPHQHAARFDSVGRPVLGFDVRILSDDGRELPTGEVGEIAGYGAGMMRGYHGRPDATEALVWRDARGRSFIRSGDLGKVDAQGFLTIVDRKKDMVISGGFNVFPSDLEAVVGQHPAVLDVTVIGIPHEKWGETPVALVIPRPGAEATPEAVRDWANERLARHQRLGAVEFRDDFPRNALGKVLKRLLREPYWAGQGGTI